MKPIKIKYELTVKGETESTIANSYIGKKEENQIAYKEGNIDVILLFEDRKIVMKRRTDEYEIELPFEENGVCEGKYYIPNMDLYLHLQVTTEKFVNKENEIFIIYKLLLNEEDLGEFDFKLEYEVEV